MSMNSATLLPWLREPWQALRSRMEGDRLPQALLIQGPSGLGKEKLAETFAQRLLCRQPREFACGECMSCRLFLAGTHPDFLRIQPAEAGKTIGVDAVRELIADLSLKPQYGGYRIVVISPAHQMNLNAANALLKTLEEPAERTLILLLSEAPGALPATILSRCQRLPIALPDPATACAWLARQNLEAPEMLLAAALGSPLRALALAGSDIITKRRTLFGEFLGLMHGREDPLVLAERWLNQANEDMMEWMLAWTTDLVRLAGAADCPKLYNPDLRDELRTLAQRLPLVGLLESWNLVLKAKRAISGQINRQLLLEELLIHWWRLGRRPATGAKA